MANLIDTYRALSDDDRRLILVTAVHFEPINQTNLKSVVMVLGWRGEDGKFIHQSFNSARRDHLVASKCWALEGNLIRCAPALVEPLVAEARERDLLKPIIEAVRNALPVHYLRGRAGIDLENRDFRRDLRFARLLDDFTAFYRLLGIRPTDYPILSDEEASMVVTLLGDMMDRAPPNIRFMVLEPKVQADDLMLAEKGERYAQFEALCEELRELPDEVAVALAFHRLMRGRFEALAALCAAPKERSWQWMFLGSLKFLAGDDNGALADFGEALKAERKLTGKRKGALPELPGVFYMLTLLRIDSHASLTQLRALAATVLERSRDYHEPFLAYFALLQYVADKLAGGGSDAQDRIHLLLRQDYSPWFTLLQSLALHWLGEAPDAYRMKLLRKLQRQAHQGGFLWYAREAALLLKAWGDTADYGVIKALDCRPLVDLRRPEPAWERLLRGLREIAAPGVVAPLPAVGEVGLAWEIEVYVDRGVALFPRERKRKGDGWGKGRAVPLKRLAEARREFDYLTPQDHAICDCITREEFDYGWGNYRAEYSLNSLSALEAAVGHPCLLRDGEPVELVQDQPRLLVSRVATGIHIALHPACNGDRNYALVVEDGRLRLFVFTQPFQRVGALVGAKGIQVPPEAEARVLETIGAIAPLITIHSEIGGEVGGEVERVEADSRLYLQMQPAGGGLRIACLVKPLGEKGPQGHPGEGAGSIFSEIDGRRLHTQRDLEVERAAADRLFAACPRLDPDGWEWRLEDPEPALETLEQIQSLGDALVLEWPQGKSLRLAGNQGLKSMQVRVGAQKDWFGVSGELTLDDGRVMDMARLLELMNAHRGRFVPIGEGEFLALSKDLRKRMEAIQSVQDRGRVHPLAAGLLDEALDGIKTKADKAWKNQLARLAEASDLDPELPTTLQASLRDYQTEGFRWLARLAHWGAGACLADDMGLGKTVQALALLLTRAADGPALVVAPTSVCANWIEEAGRFAPTLNPKTFGPGDRAAMLDGAGPFDLIVCSYGLLQTESDALAKVNWRTIVADEAQSFKNAQTKRSQAMMALRGEFRLITTGTPIENHLGELWNLFRFINPGLLGSAEHFNRRFAQPIALRGDKEAGRQLKRLIRPFILRRLKSDVLSELPERTEIAIHVELSDEERVFYEALRRTAIERIAQVGGKGPGDARFQVLAEIMRLRRACCNPRLVMPESGISSAKLQAFGEIVDELIENRHKALVFSQFVDHLGLIREWLDGQRISYQYLDGATSPKRRQEAVKAFQGGKGDLFLISLKAGGAGLNLTAADYVVHLDPWWNPAVEDQASDRAHRIGQQRPVTVYRLVARDTIEDRIIDLHRTKRDLADSLLEGTEMAARMGVEEMMALLT